MASLKLLRSSLRLRASPSLHYTPLSSPPNPLITHHQISHFSTTPSPSITNLLLNNNWSEKQLQKIHSSTPITHETIVYVLNSLEKTPLKALHFFNWVCKNNPNFTPNSLVYNQMLLILCNKTTLNEFWDFSKKFCDQGCYIHHKIYPVILGKFKSMGMINEAKWWVDYYWVTIKTKKDETVENVVSLMMKSELGLNDEVIEKLEKFRNDLSENKILRIFNALYGDPVKAFMLFNWLKDCEGYTHNAVRYNAILRVLKQKVCMKEFWCVVEEMRSAGCYLDVDTYIKISRYFTGNRMLEDLVKVYELMMDGPYKPRKEECGLILCEISRAEMPDISLIQRVVSKYEESGSVLSKAAYDAMYRSYSSLGKFEEAEKILVDMRNAGYDRDILTYSGGLFALGKAGKLDEAIKMVNEMETSGCDPDLKTWTNLIRGQCKGGHVDQALECHAMMLKRNFKVDANILDLLVTALCDKKKVDGAYTLVYDSLSRTVLRPFYSTFQILIQNLLEERELQRAMEFLPLVKNYDYRSVKQLFIDYISKYGKVEDAIKWLKALPASKYPCADTYLTILQAFLKEGRGSEARQLLDKCPPHVRSHAERLNLFYSPNFVNVEA